MIYVHKSKIWQGFDLLVEQSQNDCQDCLGFLPSAFLVIEPFQPKCCFIDTV